MAAPTPSDIRDFRRRHRLSQRALAVKLGCSRRTVEDWERGRNKPMALLALALERIALTDARGA